MGLQKSLSETCNVRNLEFKILLIKKGPIMIYLEDRASKVIKRNM